VNWTDLQWQAAESVWFADASWWGRWRSVAMSAYRGMYGCCAVMVDVYLVRAGVQQRTLEYWREVLV
jgi:hypothetical protein